MSATPEPHSGNIQQRESIKKLSKDLRDAAKTLSRTEARFLVDYYYISQGNRKRAEAQVKTLVANDEPHATLGAGCLTKATPWKRKSRKRWEPTPPLMKSARGE